MIFMIDEEMLEDEDILFITSAPLDESFKEGTVCVAGEMKSKRRKDDDSARD